MVACGTVDELRSGGPADCGWTPRRPAGLGERPPRRRGLRSDGTRVLLELGAGPTTRRSCDAALETGPVREFRRAEASLVEVFRDVIGESQPPEEQGSV